MLSRAFKKIKYILPALLAAVLIFVPSAQAATNPTLTNNMTSAIRALYTGSYTIPWYEENLSDAVTMKEIFTYEAEYTYKVSGFSASQYYSGYAVSSGRFGYTAPSGYTANGIIVNIHNESNFIQYYDTNVSGSTYTFSSTTIFDNATGFESYDAGHFTIKIEITRTPNNAEGSYLAPPDFISVIIYNTGANGAGLTYNSSPNESGDYSIIYEALEHIFTFDTNGRLIVTDPQAESSLGAIWNLLNNHFISGIEIPLQQIDDIYWLLNSVYLQLGYSGVGSSNLQYDITRLRLLLEDIKASLFTMSTEDASKVAEIESEYNALESKQAEQNAVLEAVNRPTFSVGQFDSNDMVDTGQKSNFTSLLSMIVGNGYITRIFIIVLTFATAGFVLFGKKG